MSEAPAEPAKFGWSPLCEEDPEDEGWCAYHKTSECQTGEPVIAEDADPVQVLNACIWQVGDEVDTLVRGTAYLKGVDDFDTALQLLAKMDALHRRLTTVAGTFHDRAWALRGEVYGNHHHPDLGIVSVRRTAKRPRWDHTGTGKAVVDAHMIANEGEVPDPHEVLAWVLAAAAPGYWRKGVLTELGIDYDGEDLFWSERGNPTITFPSLSGGGT